MSELQQDQRSEKPRFSPEARQEIEGIYKRYPEAYRQSAVMPILHLAQREFGGWLSPEVLAYIAEYMDIPAMRVYEVATFYTMYNLKPVGKYHVQVCTNISCWLCGSDMVMGSLAEKLKVKGGETSEDGRFTLTEVECLGACVNAPMMQINDDYYEDLTPEKVAEAIDRLP
ncbi:MAG: NADH-quinone oxidoreductase subunit NuoE [Magnetococcales bacterium]|nr:NADH-quinone oxidoreductase subunit NuoE [Magnetococcales bacterium]